VTFPAELPKEIRQRALYPAGLPDGDSAWVRDDALRALAALGGSIVAVFQVDVYVVPFGHHDVIPTGRRIVSTYHAGELALQFAERSRHLAEAFIRTGASDELFVLLFSGQDDAEEGHGTYKRRAG
jgi:hypothetical protein